MKNNHYLLIIIFIAFNFKASAQTYIIPTISYDYAELRYKEICDFYLPKKEAKTNNSMGFGLAIEHKFNNQISAEAGFQYFKKPAVKADNFNDIIFDDITVSSDIKVFYLGSNYYVYPWLFVGLGISHKITKAHSIHRQLNGPIPDYRYEIFWPNYNVNSLHFQSFVQYKFLRFGMYLHYELSFLKFMNGNPFRDVKFNEYNYLESIGFTAGIPLKIPTKFGKKAQKCPSF